MRKIAALAGIHAIKNIILSLVLILMPSKIFSQETLLTREIDKECANCFSTQVLEKEMVDGCLNVSLLVMADGSCSYALSHFSVEIPCGNITAVSNSRGWKIEQPSEDPTTGISGFKIDDIFNFGEDHKKDSFMVNYTICSSDPECLDLLYSNLEVAYKAGTCVFYEEIFDEMEPVLNLELTPSNISCFNENNGSVSIELSGGVEPYSYLWSNGATTAEINNLYAGSYSLIVTDNEGNTVKDSVSLSQPQSGINITSEVIEASCGAEDGKITLLVDGGQPPYSYIWNTLDTTEVVDGVMAGTYIVTVNDASGCSAFKAITVTESSDLQVKLFPNYLACHEEGMGEIISEVTGGTEPYSFLWSNGDTLQNLGNVNPGVYKLTLTDASSCSVTESSYIGMKSLSISSSVVNPTCYGGNDGELTITRVRNGTEPYIYSWDTGDTTATISNLGSGRYTVTVTDSLGCTLTRSINLSDRQQIRLNTDITPRDCGVDTLAELSFSASGGNPGYIFYLGDSLVTSSIIIPANGVYEFTIVDAAGCEMIQDLTISSPKDLNTTINISQPGCYGDGTGSAMILPTGGDSPYEFEWSDGSSNSSRVYLAPGDYTVSVTDANGCLKISDVVIDSVTSVTAEITTSADSVLCSSQNNLLEGVSTEATGQSWEIISTDTAWSITQSSATQASYQSGEGTATIIFRAWNDDGCAAADSITVGCKADDGSGGSGDGGNGGSDDGTGDGDGSDDGGSGGDDGSNDCMSNCWDTNLDKIIALENNCYEMEFTVKTDGSCRHDLSHLVIGLDYGYVRSLSNSRGWKYEINITDPKSGIYGFKIDDIPGFGKSYNDQFTINAEVCFDKPGEEDYLPEQIPVIYKAATCHIFETIEVFEPLEQTIIDVNVYPNPFSEQMSITLNSPGDTEVDVAVYDLKGNKVEHLFHGKLIANVKYNFTFDGNNSGERMFIYKVISKDEVVMGQLLRLR